MIVVQFLILLEDVELSVRPNFFVEILDNKINISPIHQEPRLFFVFYKYM